MISIDGRPVPDIPPSHFAALVSHVDQEVMLFQGTVRDNVTLWNPTIDERQVLDTVTEAVIDDHLRRRGSTCLLVAHRLSTVETRTEILVLQDGRVASAGRTSG